MIDVLDDTPEHDPADLDADLRAPFPAFGGKRRVAALVWERFGDVVNYVEPFAMSAAVLLARPAGHAARVETLNDLDGLIANFWRAVQADPEAVARACDWPVIEVDLHARHRALIAARAVVAAKLVADPRWYDAELAGWWAWGASCWIGAGWCADGSANRRQTPYIGGGNSGRVGHKIGTGVHAAGQRSPSRRLPDVGAGRNWDGESPQAREGKGVHGGAMRRQLPMLGGANGDSPGALGAGVHAGTMRRQLPSVGASGENGGTHAFGLRTALYDTFARLAARLRYVRIVCGDWSRVCTPAVTHRHGLTGVFLDPPYPQGAIDYAVGDRQTHAAARAWAYEAGKRPDMRIAICGYDGDHDDLIAAGWSVEAWKAHGGYGSQGNGEGRANSARERIWFSPACLRAAQGTLF